MNEVIGMSKMLSRRALFSLAGLNAVVRELGGKWPPDSEAVTTEQQALADYFRSPLYSYPLLQEMPYDMLAFEAEKCGIAVTGRSKNEIARDLFTQVRVESGS